MPQLYLADAKILLQVVSIIKRSSSIQSAIETDTPNEKETKMKKSNKTPVSQTTAKIISPVIAMSVIFGALMAAGCATTMRMDSLWPNQEVVVNGQFDDWHGALYYFEDSEFSLGLRNDEHFLYLCMTAESPMIRTQILARGLTIWFDPSGGKEKVFGIQFPIGRQESFDRRQPLNNEESAEMMARREQRDPAAQERMLQRMVREAILIGPDQDTRNQIPVEDLRGIQLKIDLSGGLMVYEMRVPLERTEDWAYAAGSAPGRPLGVGLVIPKMDRASARRSMPGSMGGRSGGGMGGRTGGGMGGRGGMGGQGMSRQRPAMMNGLKLWIKVLLADSSGS